jgi:5-methylcytosine-specific restriction endonuclease McrA
MSGPAEAVRQRARNRCEYCRIPQVAFRRGFHIEHIVARQHGGSTSLDNLALACWTCNLKKGPNLSGIDPATGIVTALFHQVSLVWTYGY